MPERELFSSLAREVLRALNRSLQRGLYPPGVVLYTQGQAPWGVFFLLEGKVKLSVSNRHGKMAMLRLVGRNETFGLSSVLTNRPYPVIAETLARSELAILSRFEFLKLQQAYPELIIWAAEQLSHELHQTWELSHLVHTGPTVEVKIALLLLLIAEKRNVAGGRGKQVALITQEGIADTLGISRETVNRAMAALKRKRLIEVLRGTIFLLKPSRLKLLGT